MDHGEVNRTFVDDLEAGPLGPQVIDLGCGPAGIVIELCQRQESIQALAIDSEVEMLEIAKREIDIAGLLDQITLQQADACAMGEFEDAMADAVISNSLLHHLDQPSLGLQTAIRLLRDGGRLFIRDLCRPDTLEDTERFVSQYAGDENEIAQQLLRQSLFAALTLDEIQEIADGFNKLGLGISGEHVQMTSDRHWTIDWCRQD
jgi:ubiquinone/menaquinone biosynthesis C-methylase UbiE